MIVLLLLLYKFITLCKIINFPTFLEMKKYNFALAHICSEIDEKDEGSSGVLPVFLEKNEEDKEFR